MQPGFSDKQRLSILPAGETSLKTAHFDESLARVQLHARVDMLALSLAVGLEVVLSPKPLKERDVTALAYSFQCGQSPALPNFARLVTHATLTSTAIDGVTSYLRAWESSGITVKDPSAYRANDTAPNNLAMDVSLLTAACGRDGEFDHLLREVDLVLPFVREISDLAAAHCIAQKTLERNPQLASKCLAALFYITETTISARSLPDTATHASSTHIVVSWISRGIAARFLSKLFEGKEPELLEPFWKGLVIPERRFGQLKIPSTADFEPIWRAVRTIEGRHSILHSLVGTFLRVPDDWTATSVVHPPNVVKTAIKNILDGAPACALLLLERSDERISCIGLNSTAGLARVACRYLDETTSVAHPPFDDAPLFVSDASFSFGSHWEVHIGLDGRSFYGFDDYFGRSFDERCPSAASLAAECLIGLRPALASIVEQHPGLVRLSRPTVIIIEDDSLVVFGDREDIRMVFGTEAWLPADEVADLTQQYYLRLRKDVVAAQLPCDVTASPQEIGGVDYDKDTRAASRYLKSIMGTKIRFEFFAAVLAEFGVVLDTSQGKGSHAKLEHVLPDGIHPDTISRSISNTTESFNWSVLWKTAEHLKIKPSALISAVERLKGIKQNR